MFLFYLPYEFHIYISPALFFLYLRGVYNMCNTFLNSSSLQANAKSVTIHDYTRSYSKPPSTRLSTIHLTLTFSAPSTNSILLCRLSDYILKPRRLAYVAAKGRPVNACSANLLGGTATNVRHVETQLQIRSRVTSAAIVISYRSYNDPGILALIYLLRFEITNDLS